MEGLSSIISHSILRSYHISMHITFGYPSISIKQRVVLYITALLCIYDWGHKVCESSMNRLSKRWFRLNFWGFVYLPYSRCKFWTLLLGRKYPYSWISTLHCRLTMTIWSSMKTIVSSRNLYPIKSTVKGILPRRGIHVWLMVNSFWSECATRKFRAGSSIHILRDNPWNKTSILRNAGSFVS